MRSLLSFLFSFILLFSSCEDNKKASGAKTKTVIIKAKDTTATQPNTKVKTPSEAIGYPKITQENVVAFLTEYGANNPETKARIITQYGNIDILLFKDTPLHRANFIYLVKQQYFDDTFFHRIVPNFIIQGGNSDGVATPRKRNRLGRNYLLPAELSNGRKHRYGTISGAKEYRENPDKQTAPYEFFIFLGPQTSTGHLNGNYTIFGKVTKGMDVVETIANLPADDGDWPLQNVFIKIEVL